MKDKLTAHHVRTAIGQPMNWNCRETVFDCSHTIVHDCGSGIFVFLARELDVCLSVELVQCVLRLPLAATLGAFARDRLRMVWIRCGWTGEGHA